MNLNHLGLYASSFKSGSFEYFSYFAEGSFGNFLIGNEFFLTPETDKLFLNKGGISKVLFLDGVNFERNDEFMQKVFTKYGSGLVHFTDVNYRNEQYLVERWGQNYFHIDFIKIQNKFFTALLYYRKGRNLLFIDESIVVENNRFLFTDKKSEAEIKKTLRFYVDKVDFICATKVLSGSNIIPLTKEIFLNKVT